MIDQRVENVIDRYISVLIAKDLNQDAGWRGESMEGRVMDWKGDMPSSQGGGGSNDAMIYQIRYVFNDKPESPRMQQAVKIMEMVKARSENQHNALVAWALLSRRPDPVTGKDHHTKERIAEEAEMSRDALYNNIKKGTEFVCQVLEIASLEAA